MCLANATSKFFPCVSKNSFLFRQPIVKHIVLSLQIRFFSEYEVVIAGGGAGGISTGARLSKVLDPGKVVIIDRAVVG